ncbi:hypothetical protein BXQ17_11595 [Polaribacter sp. BM10]|uniref:SMI1/KNR4 family protein n=1 Tax=Polaribacter sp. BM10 TaxID=1529069 RepID=UPI00098A378B|nr:SMI1/KNR4 family protein [Polaribacter sp. BM10]AQS94676.1 hypothetical protein BXQ17_11595 [Polaribacter sp. BM10]
MELKYYIILGIFSALVIILKNQNDDDSVKIEKKKVVREKSRIMLQKFKNSEDINHPISYVIIKLLENYHVHENPGKVLTNKEIAGIEDKLNLRLPKSYKIFLKYFGDGGDWIFTQNIDSIQKGGFYKTYDYHNQLKKSVYLEAEKIKTTTLLTLMVEDSNGGAWCWLTHEDKKDNEWAIAYFMEGKLYYRVENFIEWLNVVASNNEVIRFYDKEEKLGLG